LAKPKAELVKTSKVEEVKIEEKVFTEAYV
jgi:hypothetical protein